MELEKELKKQYAGVFEDWKIDLALGRIKSLRFPRRDWPDLMQELALVVLGFRYDPAHANGATEETALFSAFSRCLYYQMRLRAREAEKLRKYAAMLGVKEDGTCEEPTYEMTTPMEMDVTEVLDELDEFDRNVCHALSRGDDRAKIARDLGCDWHTVVKAMERIKNLFLARGLDGWVIK